MAAVEAHEAACWPGCSTASGSPGRADARPGGASYADGAARGRGPRPAAEVHEHLGAPGVNAPASNFYAIEASRWLGLGDAGAVRVGLAAYSTEDDVDRLLDGLAG